MVGCRAKSQIQSAIFVALAYTFLGAPKMAAAEVVQLLDNTKISGKIVHFYEGVFALQTATGETIELPVAKIKQINFALPAPRAELSTPEKTFNRYKDALLKGELAKVVDCYALMYQGVLSQQLEHSDEDFKKMQKETQSMKFEIKNTQVSGDTAVLKIQRTAGNDVETNDIRLVRENGEWKMTP